MFVSDGFIMEVDDNDEGLSQITEVEFRRQLRRGLGVLEDRIAEIRKMQQGIYTSLVDSAEYADSGKYRVKYYVEPAELYFCNLTKNFIISHHLLVFVTHKSHYQPYLNTSLITSSTTGTRLFSFSRNFSTAFLAFSLLTL